MSLDEQATYYDVLDLKPDASPDEIRDAYLRTKSAYNKDSVALYTLISPEETKDMLRRIEEAYYVLSNPEKRREYDRYHGLLTADQDMVSRPWPPTSKKIISIDRVPPMENNSDSDALLVPPSTDFTNSSANLSPHRSVVSDSLVIGTMAPKAPSPAFARDEMPSVNREYRDAVSAGVPNPAGARSQASNAMSEEIAQEIEWRGIFLRKVREARRVSVEEMSAITKISKTYLLAIEDEVFGTLPAAVYLRGFVIQIAKVLKLPHNEVAAAYMARYYQNRADKR